MSDISIGTQWDAAMRRRRIITTARACATRAWDQRTIDSEDRIIVAPQIEGGDWDALAEAAPDMTREEIEMAEQMYAERMDYYRATAGYEPCED